MSDVKRVEVHLPLGKSASFEKTLATGVKIIEENAEKVGRYRCSRPRGEVIRDDAAPWPVMLRVTAHTAAKRRR